MTDPQLAAQFVERTGADALAVSVEAAPGPKPLQKTLDLDRLAAFHAACPTPLVLDSLSDLPTLTFREAMRRGVARINFDRELRQAYLLAVVRTVPQVIQTYDTLALWQAGRDAVTVAATVCISQLAKTTRTLLGPSSLPTSLRYPTSRQA